MFQVFDVDHDPSTGPARCAALREELRKSGFDGFLAPRADAHQGEYVPPSDCRLQWLTGFAGSAGVAVVLLDKAAIFVDGRYTLQVREQVDVATFTPEHLHETPPADWLSRALKPGQRLAYDPMLHTISDVRRLKEACEKAGAELVAVEKNLIDAIWEGRPSAPLGQVSLQPIEQAGESAESKLERVRALIADNGADAVVLTQPDSIAWLFNIRGSDVEHTPLPLSFGVLRATGEAELFIDGRKLSNSVRDYLEPLTQIRPVEELLEGVGAAARAGGRVMLDPALAGEALRKAVVEAGGHVVEKADPVLLPKAIKNAAEIAGARAAHLRDGAAYARFLCWFDAQVEAGAELDEIGAAQALERFRVETGALLDISFDTISGAGPNAAICHYRVDRQSNRKIPRDSLFLIDSGAQYQDGTTDITRTLAVGSVERTMREHFTLVLQGHIAIATARFPEGVSGAQIDAFARMALWRRGLDFDHGTGHGVGSYLSVHEGPQRIAKTGTTPLRAGMIVSNEPGYYRDNSYGIRIENLELVMPAEDIAGGERKMHRFEALTLAPIDRRLVCKDMLSEEELSWLNSYHERVLQEIGPLVDEATRAWLEQATRSI